MLWCRGVIEDDAQEQWATDYWTQAMLDLDDFTRIVVHSILHLNYVRLVDGKTLSARWLEMTSSIAATQAVRSIIEHADEHTEPITQVDGEEIKQHTLTERRQLIWQSNSSIFCKKCN